jgi:methylated-DNA-[protein]-cysteine S-methyltransferase
MATSTTTTKLVPAVSAYKTPASSLSTHSTDNKSNDKPTQSDSNKTYNTPNIQDTNKIISRIKSHPTLTPFRRRVYRTLLSVPASRWTTYSALSKHLNSSPRAIGNAMKTNPFAPAVPCHRVLATDRTLGGYKGAWNNGGEYSVEKMKLLLEEGVQFDGDGKARGVCFVDFVDVK